MNRVKQLLEQGKNAFGTFIFSPDPAVVEVAGAAGLDFAIIDTEHSSLGIRDVENVMRAAAAAGMTPFVRVGSKRQEEIIRYLDAGAAGIVVPHLGDPEEITRLATSLRYQPYGDRPTCTGVRAAAYGLGFSAYAAAANDQIWLMGMVEDTTTIDRIEEVVNAPGLDVVMPGPADLSNSYGVPGQFDHPLVQSAVDRVFRAVRDRSAPALAMYVSDPAEARQWIDRGARIIVYSIDYKVLARTYREAVVQFRA